MSPILALLFSLMLIQDAPAAEAAPPVETAAVAAPASTPSMENEYPVPAGAPSDDYGLVAWCYGALSGHMALYDKVIGDVEVIEVEIAKIPGAPPADMASYKTQREAGKETLKIFGRAMEAAEKASPTAISPYGAEALKKGNAIWMTVRNGDRKYLAREWMSWGLPGRCLPTAERLQARSALFGQALNYNAKPAAAPATDALTTGDARTVEDATDEAVDETAPEAAATAPQGEEASPDEPVTEPEDAAAEATDEAETGADAAPATSGIDDLLPGEAATDEQAGDVAPESTAKEPAADAPPAEAPAETAAAPSLRGPL
ncbi:MAG: hypothetical protein GC145_17565 [Caulobacter sp.]|nr:hypothetical protein [Caulobacter sp.]